MKEKYITPVIDIEAFETCDILTVSEAATLNTVDVASNAAQWNSDWDEKLR